MSSTFSFPNNKSRATSLYDMSFRLSNWRHGGFLLWLRSYHLTFQVRVETLVPSGHIQEVTAYLCRPSANDVEGSSGRKLQTSLARDLCRLHKIRAANLVNQQGGSMVIIMCPSDYLCRSGLVLQYRMYREYGLIVFLVSNAPTR